MRGSETYGFYESHFMNESRVEDIIETIVEVSYNLKCQYGFWQSVKLRDGFWINKITIYKTNRFINQITLSTSICISIHPFRDPDTFVQAIAINLPISGYEPKDLL